MADTNVTLENFDNYLTKELFSSIISKNIEKEPFTIVHFENVKAIQPGENFISTIIKNLVKIQLNDGIVTEYQFISKIIGSSILEESVVDGMMVFPKEVGMYQDIVPEFERLWKKLGNTDIRFGPKLYYAELKPRKMLIFENLNNMGYNMANRFTGLAEDQVLLVLEKISKWHAVSRVYYDNHKPIDLLLTRGLINSAAADDAMYDYNRLLHINFVEVLEMTNLDETYLEVVRNWKNKVIPHLLKTVQCDPCDFNVLNHGDLWTNNMMFHQSGILKDVKFIDYQLGNYGSPALDLMYFFVASVRHELLAAKFDHFIAYYHKHLVAALKQLNLTRIPTLKEIHLQILKKSFYSIVMIMGGLQTITIDQKNDGIDLTNAIRDDEIGYAIRKKMVENPRVLGNVLGLLTFLGGRGMLDF